MSQIEVMKQALKAMTAAHITGGQSRIDEAATALRQAIEKAGNEPCEYCKRGLKTVCLCHLKPPTAPAQPDECKDGCPPLQVCDYCQGTGGEDAAPAQPLTDDEILEIVPGGMVDCLLDPYDMGVGDGDESRSVKKDIIVIARAIEAHIKGATL